MSKKIKAILLIDDDPDDQLLFQEALSEADTSVTYLSAFNGMDALEKLNSGVVPIPDLIFMDMNMPRMNGLDCLKELKKNEWLKAIAVTMYSTSGTSGQRQECFENGAIGYIAKPSDFWQLRDMLKQILTEGPDTLKNNTLVKL